MEILPEGLMLEAETYNALITTMRRDCRVLESFRIMDYSLLIGIHNLDQAAKEQAVSLLLGFHYFVCFFFGEMIPRKKLQNFVCFWNMKNLHISDLK